MVLCILDSSYFVDLYQITIIESQKSLVSFWRFLHNLATLQLIHMVFNFATDTHGLQLIHMVHMKENSNFPLYTYH